MDLGWCEKWSVRRESRGGRSMSNSRAKSRRDSDGLEDDARRMFPPSLRNWTSSWGVKFDPIANIKIFLTKGIGTFEFLREENDVIVFSFFIFCKSCRRITLWIKERQLIFPIYHIVSTSQEIGDVVLLRESKNCEKSD